MKIYEVGGSVRDGILGVSPKDRDFSVEADSFAAMKEELVARGFTIFQEREEYFTICAQFPQGTEERKKKITGDFVLCRKDGVYSDGRRPDMVEMGTIYDDLARRDFTVGAIAKAEDGTIIDPFGGVSDLRTFTLRAVGRPEDRLDEDALRALRAIRFVVTKGFFLEGSLRVALQRPEMAIKLAQISMDRRREELDRTFKADPVLAIKTMAEMGDSFMAAAFGGGIKLFASNKKA